MTTELRTAGASERGNWTTWLRTRLTRMVPPGQALPDRQPAYVASWIYVFGVASIAALLAVLLTGAWLALGGATPRHVNNLGHFVNSMHL